MRLDHLLAADSFGKPLDEARRGRGERVVRDVGFVREDGRLVLDGTHPWVIIEDQEGLWRVHAESPMPEHLFDTTVAALEELVREAGLVRLDPLSRREISAMEWARRVADESRVTLRRVR
jgi:hypothetical protein